MSPTEAFSDEERTRLAPFVTDLDGPVFALVNLPETVKAALFARYSRHPGTLRRLLLDEFAGDLPPAPAAPSSPTPPAGRAAELYERVFVGYGDDSVAQLGGVHVACEWVSNVLTKILQRPRLGAYLEQSTRYIAYDRPLPGTGGWRYHREPALGPQYEQAMDELFTAYARLLPQMTTWVAERFPADVGAGSQAAHERAVRAKALDLVRGLLPAGSLSHMGLFASGQAVEALILHLLAHPLPEARRCGERLLTAVRAALPSFVARVERPDRGGALDRLPARARRRPRRGSRGGSGSTTRAQPPPRATPARRSASPTSTATSSNCSAHCCSRPPTRARSGSAPASRSSARTNGRRRSPSCAGRARTAATGPGAASRRSAIASRSSPTTAPSATCSATGC